MILRIVSTAGQYGKILPSRLSNSEELIFNIIMFSNWEWSLYDSMWHTYLICELNQLSEEKKWNKFSNNKIFVQIYVWPDQCLFLVRQPWRGRYNLGYWTNHGKQITSCTTHRFENLQQWRRRNYFTNNDQVTFNKKNTDLV